MKQKEFADKIRTLKSKIEKKSYPNFKPEFIWKGDVIEMIDKIFKIRKSKGLE